jgi:Ni,Fe-hydrogenase I cytochrome b subunit
VDVGLIGLIHAAQQYLCCPLIILRIYCARLDKSAMRGGIF